jgi:Uma2 family endonuclease
MGAIKVEYLPQYTIADYLQWEGAWELIHGIPYAMSPSPTSTHQRIARELLLILDNALNRVTCDCEIFYELDWQIRDDSVVRPDLLIICGKVMDEPYLTRAPDLIIEVLSSASVEKDMGLKRDLYESAGVKYYVLIDRSDERITLLGLREGKYGDLPLDQTLILGSCAIRPQWEALWGKI